MKKLIALLLAVSALSLSATAFADVAVDGTVTNNNKTATTLAADNDNTDAYPCFKNGQDVQFKLSGVSDGAQLTLISSKVGETADNSTIQYINQYTVSGTTIDISYKVRALTDGVYNVLIKNGEENVVDFFYKVGNPEVALATKDSSTAIVTKAEGEKYSVAYVAAASIGSADVSFAEAGVENYTIAVSNGTTSGSSAITAETLDTIVAGMGDLDGAAVDVLFGVTVYNVQDGVTLTPSVN